MLCTDLQENHGQFQTWSIQAFAEALAVAFAVALVNKLWVDDLCQSRVHITEVVTLHKSVYNCELVMVLQLPPICSISRLLS